MALTAETRIKVKLELLWLRSRGVTFVTSPTEDEAIAAITADQEAMIAALLPSLAAATCAVASPDAAQIKKIRDIEFAEGALANLEHQRYQLARQIAALLGLIDLEADRSPLLVCGGPPRSTFMGRACEDDCS